MSNLSINYKLENHILSVIWVSLVLIPTNMFFYLFVPVSLMCLYSPSLTRQIGSINRILILLVIGVTISALTCFAEDYVTYTDHFRAIALILIFISFGKIKGTRVLPGYLLFLIVYLFLSQFATLTPFGALVEYFRSVYPPPEFYVESGILYGVDNITIDKIGISRLGGLFYDPNIFASYMGVILTVCLCEKQHFKKGLFVLALILALVSLISTGSRTAMVITLLICIGYCYIRYSKIGLLLAIGISIFFFTVLVLVFQIDTSELRGFKVGEGMDDSFGVKMDLLSVYLSRIEVVKYFFGAYSGNVFKTIFVNTDSADFDFGNILIWYGAFFYIALIIFYVKVFRTLKSIYLLFSILLLWSFSNSLLISYRMAPFWFITLSIYYQRSVLAEKSQNHKNVKT